MKLSYILGILFVLWVFHDEIKKKGFIIGSFRTIILVGGLLGILYLGLFVLKPYGYTGILVFFLILLIVSYVIQKKHWYFWK